MGLFFHRGDQFRREYARLGNVWSILSLSVHVVAMTVTATSNSNEDICASLGMKNPDIVSFPPEKGMSLYMWHPLRCPLRTVSVQLPSSCTPYILKWNAALYSALHWMIAPSCIVTFNRT